MVWQTIRKTCGLSYQFLKFSWWFKIFFPAVHLPGTWSQEWYRVSWVAVCQTCWRLLFAHCLIQICGIPHKVFQPVLAYLFQFVRSKVIMLRQDLTIRRHFLIMMPFRFQGKRHLWTLSRVASYSLKKSPFADDGKLVRTSATWEVEGINGMPKHQLCEVNESLTTCFPKKT